MGCEEYLCMELTGIERKESLSVAFPSRLNRDRSRVEDSEAGCSIWVSVHGKDQVHEFWDLISFDLCTHCGNRFQMMESLSLGCIFDRDYCTKEPARVDHWKDIRSQWEQSECQGLIKRDSVQDVSKVAELA